MAHRGDQTVSPENTIVSLKNAILLEIDVVETDIRLTKDNELVLFHDETLDRTTDATGSIIDYTLEELKNVDLGYSFTLDEGNTYPCRGKGYRIVTLREVFERFPTMKFNLDIKNQESVAPKLLADLIKEYNKFDSVMVASFHDHQIKAFRKILPRVLTSASPREVKKYIFLQKIRLISLAFPSYQAFQVPIEYGNIRIVTPNFIKNAHSQGIAVHVWVINDRTMMNYLIELGVDGIFTDDPWLLLEVLEEKNLLE